MNRLLPKRRLRTFVKTRAFSTKSTNDVVSYLRSLQARPDPKYNITENIISKVGKNLHMMQDHPLGIIKSRIEAYCNQYAEEHGFSSFLSVQTYLLI